MVGRSVVTANPVHIAEHAADGSPLREPTEIDVEPIMQTGYSLDLDRIDAVVASDTKYLVAGVRLNDSYIVAIDRITLATSTYALLDLGRVYSSVSVARRGDAFMAARGDGGGRTGGDGTYHPLG